MKVCLGLTVFIAVVFLLMPCSRRGKGRSPADQTEAEAERSAESYLALLGEGRWPEAWERLTERRRNFWNGLARAVVEGPNPDYPDLVVRCVRDFLGGRAAPGSGYELFGEVAPHLERNRKRLLRGDPGFRLRRVADVKNKGTVRLRIEEQGVEMRLKCVGGSWLVDGIALDDRFSDESIESPGEEFEIFLRRGATVRLPGVEEGALEERALPRAVTLQVDSSGSVYLPGVFLPKASLVDYLSMRGDRLRDWKVPDAPSQLRFRWLVSADLKWSRLYPLLEDAYRAACPRLVFGVKAVTQEKDRGAIVWMVGNRPLAKGRLLCRDLIDSGGLSATEVGRLAHRVGRWRRKTHDDAVELSFSSDARWEDVLRAILAVGKNARSLLLLSVLEQGEGAGEQVRVYADRGPEIEDVAVYAPAEKLPLRVALLK